MRLAFTIAYLGDHFFGSQQQNSNRTVEGEFIATCKRLNLFDDWREAKFAFAGRTDRGVHAFGQVCSFTTDLPQRAVECLNLQLPRDCWCRGYAEVDEDFHPRYAARSRTYRYYLIESSLDITPMAEAARYFEGTHNFSSIARTEGRNPLRTLHRVRVWKEDPFIIIEVQGESFLWHMVRGMTTVLREVGAGTADSGKVTTLLEKTMKDRVSPAPAEGLVLWEVDCGIRFIPVPLGERHEGYLTVEQKKHQLQGKIISLLHCHDTFSPTPRAS